MFKALGGDGPQHPALRRDLLTIFGDDGRGQRLAEWRMTFEADSVPFRDIAEQWVFDSRAGL